MKTVLSIIVVLALLVGGYMLMNTQTPAANVSETTPTTNDIPEIAPVETPVVETTENTEAPKTGEHTLAEVALHKDASSCWSVINNNVYDLTSWIEQHPGGERNILKICGTDGSSAFNGKHGGQENPEDQLNAFYIGVLTP